MCGRGMGKGGEDGLEKGKMKKRREVVGGREGRGLIGKKFGRIGGWRRE